jgi:hypothetical protein
MGLGVDPGQFHQQRSIVNDCDTATLRSRIQRKDFHGNMILIVWIEDGDKSFSAADRRLLNTGLCTPYPATVLYETSWSNSEPQVGVSFPVKLAASKAGSGADSVS